MTGSAKPPTFAASRKREKERGEKKGEGIRGAKGGRREGQVKELRKYE